MSITILFYGGYSKGESLFIHKLAVKRGRRKRRIELSDTFCKRNAREEIFPVCGWTVTNFAIKSEKIYENEGFVYVEEKCFRDKYPTAFYVYKAE